MTAAVQVGGWQLVELVDGRQVYADRDSADSLVGPGSRLYLPEDKARHWISRGWAALVAEEAAA